MVLNQENQINPFKEISPENSHWQVTAVSGTAIRQFNLV